MIENCEQAPALDKWTEVDKANLVELQKMEIKMEDIAYGRLLFSKKRDLEAAVSKMTQEERAALRRIDEADAAEALTTLLGRKLDEADAAEALTTEYGVWGPVPAIETLAEHWSTEETGKQTVV